MYSNAQCTKGTSKNTTKRSSSMYWPVLAAAGNGPCTPRQKSNFVPPPGQVYLPTGRLYRRHGTARCTDVNRYRCTVYRPMYSATPHRPLPAHVRPSAQPHAKCSKSNGSTSAHRPSSWHAGRAVYVPAKEKMYAQRCTKDRTRSTMYRQQKCTSTAKR